MTEPRKRARRNYGMGSIVQRGRRWAVVRSLGRNPETGKYRQRWFYFPTKEEAKQFQLSLAGHVKAGGSPPPAKFRVDDLFQRWLHDYAEMKVAPTTLRSYRETIEGHLSPALGNGILRDLKAGDIQRYLSEKLRAGLSSTTVHYHGTLLREILRYAVRLEFLMRNPSQFVEIPRRRRMDMRVLDEEQTRLFLGEAKRTSPYYRLYLTAIITGMRQGELLGLRWRDVDLLGGMASIQQTFYRLSGNKKKGVRTEAIFKPPKSEKSRRRVALPPALVEELRGLHEEQGEYRQILGAEYQDADLVFCQVNGKPLHAHNIVRRDMRKVLERAKLPRIRFHDLRHGSGSLDMARGVNPKVVQERLGHSTVAFTLQVYGHVLPGMREEAAQDLADQILGRPAAGSS